MKKVAIVTGGGSGIGLAIAQRLAASDCQVVIFGRDEAKLREAVRNCRAAMSYLVCDVANAKSVPIAVQQVIDQFGQIDVLVNNAGINRKKPLIEVTDEDFMEVVQTNLVGVFTISREVSKQMIKQQSGSIIQISSMAAIYGVPKIIAYSASKAAVEGMTRAMASELSAFGVRVNCIAPGFIVTEMTDKALNSDPERKAKALGRTPMARMGQPMEIADAVAYLASDQASYITGVVLPVDGGNSVGF